MPHGLSTQGGYWIAARSFVKENPELIKIVLEEVHKLGEWSKANTREVAEIVGRDTKLDSPTLETIVKRRRFGIRPITDKVIAGQQEISDLFYKQKFITKKINVKDVTLTPEEYAAIFPAEIKP